MTGTASAWIIKPDGSRIDLPVVNRGTFWALAREALNLAEPGDMIHMATPAPEGGVFEASILRTGPEPPPVPLVADLDWLDWAPGSHGRGNETPRQWMERKRGGAA